MAVHSGRIQNGRVAATARNENGFDVCSEEAHTKMNWSGFYKTMTITLAAQAILCG
jgi:hypothetical protein